MKCFSRSLFLVSLGLPFSGVVCSQIVTIQGQEGKSIAESIEKIPDAVLVGKPKQVKILLPEVGFSPEVGILPDGSLIPEVGLITFDMEYREDGTSYGKAAFPAKGRLVGTGNVILFSGMFELINGTLSYRGEGIFGPILINVSLSQLDYLTPDEKAAVDAEIVSNRAISKRRKEFLDFLEDRGEEALADHVRKENATDIQEQWEVEQVTTAIDDAAWEDLEKFALLRMWHEFTQEEADSVESEKKDLALDPDVVFVKQVTFLLVPTNGALDFPVGRLHIFNLKSGLFVCRYKESPYITSPIVLGGQVAEVRLVERDLSATIHVKNGSLTALLPRLEALIPQSVLAQGRFDGLLHFSPDDGLELQGRFFDVRTDKPLEISPLPGLLPVVLDTVRIKIHPTKELALQARAEVCGIPAEFFAMIHKDEGFLARVALRPAPVRLYIPQLPAREFDLLSFSGKVEWSKGDGILIRGKLQQEKQEAFPLWGIVFDHGALDFNLSTLQGTVFGDFSVFNLKARGGFSMKFGKEPQVSFMAELANAELETWEPPSLGSFLDGAQKQIAPFMFKRLRLIGGVEVTSSPIKSFKKALHEANKKDIQQTTKKEGSAGVKLSEKAPVLATTTYVPDHEISFFCALMGEAFILNELCYAAAKVSFGEKNSGLLIIAEPTGRWSLARGFPEVFAYQESDNFLVQYMKNVVGGAELSNLSFIFSTFKDIEFGVERGVNIMGTAAYAGNLQENPLFRPFLAESHPLPIYLKKDGQRGIGITMAMVINPIDVQNSVVRLGVGTGDVGIFFRTPGLEDFGFKDLTGELLFYPFALMGSGKTTILFKGGEKVTPMRLAAEAIVDKFGVGGVISGVGDVDFAQLLPLFIGAEGARILDQVAVFRDWSLEYKMTWAAIISMIGAIGTAIPTLGIGTVIGIIGFILTSIESFGISGGIEIGQGIDPLKAQFFIKGGLDITSLILEVLYEKPGGFLSLAMFLADIYVHILTLGMKDKILPEELRDMRKVQAFVEKFFPLDLEKFYLKFVPLGTRIGEVTVPFGVGGSLYLTVLGKTVGADLMLDSNGAYAVAFVDPIDWGIYKLVPSKTQGIVAKQLEDKYREWGLLSFAPEQEHEKKVKFEASAHLEKGITFLTDFDLMIADMVGGSFRGMLSLHKGLDLQGHVEVKLPGLAEQLGLPGGASKLWVKAWQLNFDNPIVMLYQGDPKNIALEIGLENSFSAAIQTMVRGALDGAKTAIEGAVNALLQNVLKRAGEDELAALRVNRDRICNDTGLFGVVKDLPACAAAEIALRSTEARNTVFSTLDQAGLQALPDLVRTGVTTIANLGIGGITAGRFAFDAISSIVEIKKIWWRGSVVDVAEGKIPGFTVDLVLLGNRITGEIGGIDLQDPLKGVRNMVNDITAFVARELAKILQIPQPELFKI